MKNDTGLNTKLIDKWMEEGGFTLRRLPSHQANIIQEYIENEYPKATTLNQTQYGIAGAFYK